MGCLGASVLLQPLRAKRAVRDTQPVTGSHPDLSYLPLPQVPPVPSTAGSALLSRWHLTVLSAEPWRLGTWYQPRGCAPPEHQHPWVLPGGSPSHPPPPSPAHPCCFCTPTAPAGPMHGGGCSWYFTFCLAGFALLAPVLLTRRLPRTSSPLPSCSKTVRAVRPVRRAAASLKMLLGARGDLLPGAGNFEGACWYLQCL